MFDYYNNLSYSPFSTNSSSSSISQTSTSYLYRSDYTQLKLCRIDIIDSNERKIIECEYILICYNNGKDIIRYMLHILECMSCILVQCFREYFSRYNKIPVKRCCCCICICVSSIYREYTVLDFEAIQQIYIEANEKEKKKRYANGK